MSKQIFRATWHDYRARCIYMVTVVKSRQDPYFGQLAGNWAIPTGSPGGARIDLLPLGRCINDLIARLPEMESAVNVLEYCIMPDHVHILLFVRERMKKPLGFLMARFKVAVNKTSGFNGVFEKGYNDQILKPSRQLSTLFRYIRENPQRLAVRRANPQFFRRLDSVTIGGRRCRSYGNCQLLDHPFKEQVIVHRADTTEQLASKREKWLRAASRGGVLVSLFISPAEKAIRNEADDAGARFILITHQQKENRNKPSGRDFELCEAGRMLIVAPASLDVTLSRSSCMTMNTLAESICSRTFRRI